MANPSSASSSMTSTSHTLTALPPTAVPSHVMHPSKSNGSLKSPLLAALLPELRYKFLQPDESICNTAIAATKETLDHFATRLVDEQALRLQEQRKRNKRKRGEIGNEVNALKIRKVHTQGFGVEQVWEQAKRVIDALRGEVVRELEELDEHQHDNEVQNSVLHNLRFGDDGFEVESADESFEEQDQDQDDDSSHEEVHFLSKENDDDEEISDLDEHVMDGDDLDDDKQDEKSEAESAGVFVPDPHGLNDGFFSIEDFNRQTEFLEQQDAAADSYTGEASDEDDIDWEADPLSMSMNSRRTRSQNLQDDDDDDNEEEENNGPTFGDVDLNAPEGDSEDGQEDADMDGDVSGAGDNTNEVLYKDFFEPPPRRAERGEREQNYLQRQARKSQPQLEDDPAEMDRAISDVRRDLFDDMSENEDSEDALSDVDPANPKSRRSAHERRQAKLAEEIRRLEAALVAKREWMLSGEARAADRPLNSLLEQDLDFERTGKPVPVITAEVSESIEELIKRRILAQDFDELIRRRPDSDSVPANARRGQFELDDTKAQHSLAEIYEQEHVKAINPDTYMSKADEKVKNQHQEIEGLWKEVSAKLDALSSWHYKPKPPTPSLTVVADVATVSMEDAQPTTAAGVSGGESMLAPQEIYKAGKEREGVGKGEVVPKSGAPIARVEMSREEKLRRRRREKERIRKRGGDEVGKRPEGKKAKGKRDTVSDLKKAGVKIIGRKGEIVDVEGNKLKTATVKRGGGSFKL
ncbi:MAG: U3 snoRNP protein [Claussenomyces sp. TS43310]|nr:MAG: U3 snoRNP protein [Claussenomyces sp. TS43310]